MELSDKKCPGAGNTGTQYLRRDTTKSSNYIVSSSVTGGKRPSVFFILNFKEDDNMPKRKRMPKLPNGYGSIRYLGKGRRNPYAVHPPTERFTENGVPVRPSALCYVDTWIKGFTVLTAYKAGNYYPGYENTLIDLNTDAEDASHLEELAKKILSDYNQFKGVPIEKPGKTFTEVYQEFFDWKYKTDTSKAYSQSAIYSTKAAYKNCETLHDKVFSDLRHDDLQTVIDKCTLKYASLEHIVTLFHQMYAYADIYELVDKDYSAHVKINRPDDDENGVPFTEEELKKMWAHKDDDIIEFLLIMCYSGYRIRAYKDMKVNLDEGFFQGGIKTIAGKNRKVPIHPSIRPLVEQRLNRYNSLLPGTCQNFRLSMYAKMDELDMDKHTPHDCRHTFSALCEKYRVNDNDRKRLLGHSFGSDITNSKYGHRTIEDLRVEIEKIPNICD